ncbi:B-cell receptor CD22-like [Silurus meridionalis]|uniref:B-cell receptor CD22-like n=1 Tax=Silurus meridionalis TaxID=175797 RepID=UPI001EEA9897|nr:B-cell receptor CD22-like [Silurus meridionalis]
MLQRTTNALFPSARPKPVASSDFSDAVTLIVAVKPKPVASINPDKQVFSGDTVTLRCEIQDESVSRWQYSWYKDGSLSLVSIVQMYTISSVEVTHTGKYTCKGRERSDAHCSSHLSDATPCFNPTARPKPVASINPDKQVFSGETVTLSCEIQDKSVSRWQCSWYKDASLSPVSSVQMYRISSVEVTHTGKYTCKGRESGGSRSSHLSDAVTLTVSVKPKPVASINPDKQVFSGDTVTLRCEIQDESVSRWQYSWYKDASLSPVSSVPMYRISSVEVTHTGKYTCKGRESGGSRSSHLSDAVTLTVSAKLRNFLWDRRTDVLLMASKIYPDKPVLGPDLRHDLLESKNPKAEPQFKERRSRIGRNALSFLETTKSLETGLRSAQSG